MESVDQNMITFEHKYTSDEKLGWFGYGEWVEEPDYGMFTHKEIICEIRRTVIPPLNAICAYGGHLCGYVLYPESEKLSEEEIDSLEVHGGITYIAIAYREDSHNLSTLGFDCAHVMDLLPSLSVLKKRGMEFPSPRLRNNATYKNFDYVVEETKKLADQVRKILEEKN